MFFSALILASAAIVAPAPNASALPAAAEEAVARMLADQWIRAARAMLENEPVTVDKIRLAILLGEAAVDRSPNNIDAWRFLLSLAEVGERHDLQRTAIERLSQLDPKDEVIRFRRLNQAIDDLDTAEERESLYKRLLAPERRNEIGAAVASRLALDLALLKQSQGDLDGFSEWLAEATAIDASNRKASALAAGFFRANVDDPAAEAELLVGLVMADPTDAMSMLTLGQLLLEHGAYNGAQRLYQLAIKVAPYTGRPPITDDLIADAAIALWANGNTTEAMRIILEHQRIRDQILRQRTRQEQPDITPLDLAKVTATLSPTLASVRAMIQQSLGGELATRMLQATVASYDKAVAAAGEGESADPVKQARLLLEQASIMYWLGGDADEAAKRVAQAGELQPLTPEAQARFDGWTALRSGDPAAARTILEPLAENDPLAAVGLAKALLEQGETKEAARQLLSVARRQPGTLLGVWSFHTLTDMLKQRFTVSDSAAALDRLVSRIPATFDRYVDDASLALSLRITPTKVQFEPFEPVTVRIEITNHTNVPLAIDPEGPIRPHLALVPSVQVARVKLPPELRPFIVDIDHKLRLEPHERMTFDVDLRQSQLGTVLDTQALRGATVSVRGLINFMVTPQGALRPSLLGSEVMTERMRVEGVRVSRDWLQDAMARVMQPDSLDDLAQLALLAPVAAAGAVDKASPDDRQLLADARQALIDTFPKLGPNGQAWLLGVIPRTAEMEQFRTMARQSTDSAVLLSYLINQSSGTSDPLFDAVQRGDDKRLGEIAALFKKILEPASETRTP